MGLASRRGVISEPLFNLTAGDAEFTASIKSLKKTKALAAGLLVIAILILIVARALQPRYPVMGFVAAFSEAAMIGGIADWYAVVALFRRPLGLPIPHTAIIPENQARIAEKLGSFIETQFLRDAVVTAKLREIDFSEHVSQWLSARSRVRPLAGFILRLAPDFLDAIERSSMGAFLLQRLRTQMNELSIAPLAAGALDAFAANGRHQKLLDDLLEGLRGLISRPESTEALRTRIRDEMPTLLNLYRVDRLILNRIVASAGSFVDEVLSDPDHPFRREFDRFVHSFIESMRTSPEFAEKIEDLKRTVLDRPEVGALLHNFWQQIRLFIGEQAQSPNNQLQKDIETVLLETGRRFQADPDLRIALNQGMAQMIASVVADQKAAIAGFISSQMKSWDMQQLVTIIEANVGQDLQYIRFNGMLIGGLVGLILYTVELLLRF